MPDPIAMVREIAPLNKRISIAIRQGGEPEVIVMPYERDEDLPPSVQKLDKAKRDQWRSTFNAVLQKDKDEEKAFKIAWAHAEECDAETGYG